MINKEFNVFPQNWTTRREFVQTFTPKSIGFWKVYLFIKKTYHYPLNDVHCSIYSMINTEPLVYYVRKCQLSFLGHVLRLPEEEPARRYAFYVPPHGKRKPGRPRTLYVTYIQRVLRYHEVDISADEIATLAKDRCAWRNLVIAFSAAEGWWWWWWWWWWWRWCT